MEEQQLENDQSSSKIKIENVDVRDNNLENTQNNT